MIQDVFFLASLLIGAVLTFVGLASFLPAGIYRKIFGYVWPVDPSGSRDEALQRRLVGVVITTLGLVTLRAAIVELLGHLRG